MKSRNKKLICFLIVMIITLISCCIVSASDNVDKNITTTQNNEVTSTNVEQTTANNNYEKTATSTESVTQSDETTIEETDDQNDVEKENKTNAKAITKAKITNKTVKTATNINGAYVLNGDITLSDGYSLTGDFSLDGQGHTLTYTGSGNLFTSNGYKVTLSNIVIRNVPGYVIYGGYGHNLTACEFYDCIGIYKFDGGVGNTVLITTTNCYFSGTKARAFDAQVTGGTTGNIFVAYTSIFENYVNPIFYCFNKGQFRGSNLIFGNTIATNAAYENNEEIQYQGSKPTVSIQKKAFDTNIVITAPDVHVNQTNNVNVRLTATMDDGTIVGIPHEDVTIKVTYANGSTQNLNGITNMNGQVYLTSMNGDVTIPVIAAKTGVVRVNVTFAGSRWTVDTSTGERLYHAATKTQTYNVIGIPTTTTLSLNSSNVDKGEKVRLTANIVNNDDNSVVVNEGSVTFYRGNTQIGTATVSNGVATLDYTTDTSGTLNIIAVYSNAANYNTSTSTASSLTVKADLNLVASIVLQNESTIVVQARLTQENGSPVSGATIRIPFTVNGLNLTSGTHTYTGYNETVQVLGTVTIQNTTNSNGYTNLTINTRYKPGDKPYSYVEEGHYDVIFDGNDLYGSVISNIELTKLSGLNITFPTTANPSIVTDDSLHYYYYGNIGDSYSFSAHVHNSTGSEISSGTVRFWVDPPASDSDYYSTKFSNHYYLFYPRLFSLNGTDNKYNVTYLENNLYRSSEPVFLGIRVKMNTTLPYQFVNTTYGNVTLQVKVANLTDNSQVVPGSVVIVKRNGAEIARGTTGANGLTNIVLPDIGVGNSPELTLVYEGNVSHNANTTVIPANSVTIVNRDAVVEVEEEIVDYIKSTVTITANVTDVSTGEGLTGSVAFKKDGTTLQTVNLVDGQASYTYTIVANETLTITSVFTASNYNEAVNSTDVVGMLIPTVTSLDASISANVGKAVNISASVVNDSSIVNAGNVPQGSVTFYYGTQELGTVNVVDGVAKLENVVFNATNASGKISASFTDSNAIYNDSASSSSVGALVVNQGTAHIAMQEEYSDIYGTELTITVNVTDVNSDQKITSGNVIFKKAGTVLETSSIDSNGQASFTYTVGSDSQVTVTAELSNTNYTTATNSSSVNRIFINTTTTISNVPASADVGQSFTFNVRLNTTGNQAVSGKSIVVKVNGEAITGLAQTDNNGEITVTYIPKNNISIVINATFEGDEIYAKSNDTDSSLTGDKISLIPTKVTLDITPTTGTVYSPISITVGLTNNTNNEDNTVTGTVKLYINGNSQDITINPTQKTVTVTYVPEDNQNVNVYAEYAGQEGIYDANRTENKVIQVNLIDTNLAITVPSEVTVAESFRFNITLTNATSPNDKIGGKVVKITATVNSDSVDVYYDDVNNIYYATYTVSNNTDDLVFGAAFAGDNSYKQSDATSVTLDKTNIKLIPTQMGIIVPDDVKVGTEFTFKINLTNSSGEAISGQSIVVEINNQTYTGSLTYNNGLYEGTYTATNNTDIVINATFASTNVYEGVNAINDTLTGEHIVLIATLVDVEHPTTVNVSQSIELVINLTDEYQTRLNTSNITVKVDGHELTAGKTFSADYLTLTVDYPTTKSETLRFDVSYPGLEGVYYENSTTFNVEVVKIPTKTTITVLNNTAGNQRFR